MREPRSFAQIALSGEEVLELTRGCPEYSLIGLTFTKGFELPPHGTDPCKTRAHAYCAIGFEQGEHGELHIKQGDPIYKGLVEFTIDAKWQRQHSEFLSTNHRFTGQAQPKNLTHPQMLGSPLTLRPLISKLRTVDKEKPTYILRAGLEWPIIGAYYIPELGSLILQALVNDNAYFLV